MATTNTVMFNAEILCNSNINVVRLQSKHGEKKPSIISKRNSSFKILNTEELFSVSGFRIYPELKHTEPNFKFSRKSDITDDRRIKDPIKFHKTATTMK